MFTEGTGALAPFPLFYFKTVGFLTGYFTMEDRGKFTACFSAIDLLSSHLPARIS